MPTVLIHHRFLVGHRVGPRAAGPAAVSGSHDRRAVVPAKQIEGHENTEQHHKDSLRRQNEAHLPRYGGQSRDVDGHQHQGQVELQEHMLNGVHLGGVELNVGGLHHIAPDGPGKEAANELGHLDFGDVVQQAVDGHSQSSQQQAHGEHGDHPAVVQLRSST